jgi:nicotinate-nucleotide adenylyltransferase
MKNLYIAPRLGVFGGTFDPIHNGHFAIAEAVRVALELDEVWFVVAADQWLRKNPPVAPIYARLKMIELALRRAPYFKASDVEIVRGGSTYTIDTLTYLRTELGEDVEMHLIVGADSAICMDQWKMAEELRSLAKVVVVGRPRIDFNTEKLSETHPAKEARYVEGPMRDISATAIRRLMKAGETISGMVDAPVSEYIMSHGLYS